MKKENQRNGAVSSAGRNQACLIRIRRRKYRRAGTKLRTWYAAEAVPKTNPLGKLPLVSPAPPLAAMHPVRDDAPRMIRRSANNSAAVAQLQRPGLFIPIFGIGVSGKERKRRGEAGAYVVVCGLRRARIDRDHNASVYVGIYNGERNGGMHAPT